MSDFFQNGVITNLSLLNKNNYEDLEKQLIEFNKTRSIALILPALFSEVHTKALKGIIETLKGIEFIDEIIITLGRTNSTEFKEAKEFFRQLPQKYTLIWNDGDNIKRLYRTLDKLELSAGPDGKGRSVWMAFGYLLARGKAYMIALHDCDILTYSKDMLVRLCYPVASPYLLYEFCKGYYSRFSDRLHGRVTRLLLPPLIKSLKRIIGPLPFLEFLNSFRYILAGEFSLIMELARVIRIQPDWGLEIGILSEVYQNCSIDRIAQVELMDNYEHKHQPLSFKDPKKGLLKMAIDIIKTFLQNLASQGVIISSDFIKTLKISFINEARKESSKFEDLAKINSLIYDRHAEALCIEAFMRAIDLAAAEYFKSPKPIFIPSWRRVISAMPSFFEMLLEAVEQDNKNI